MKNDFLAKLKYLMLTFTWTLDSSLILKVTEFINWKCPNRYRWPGVCLHTLFLPVPLGSLSVLRYFVVCYLIHQ